MPMENKNNPIPSRKTRIEYTQRNVFAILFDFVMVISFCLNIFKKKKSLYDTPHHLAQKIVLN